METSDDRDLARVLFAAEIDPSQKDGSFEDQAFALGRAFRARGGLFLPLFPAELGAEVGARYRGAGLRAECLDLGRFRLKTLLRLAAIIRENRIGVVHWNFYEPLKNGYLWGLSLLVPGVRHFYTDHTSRPSRSGGPASRLKGAGKRWLYGRYERILCVSDFVAGSLQGGSRWGNVGRWHHLIDTARFAPDLDDKAEVRERHGAAGRFVVLVVAHLVPEKGVDVALRAFAGLPEDAVLWVVGGGSEAENLRGLAGELGLADRVRFFGVCRDVAPFMKAADCLVCPSTWAEAAGLVNIEGLACGLPVVASRIGGIPEIVQDGVTGVLFPPRNVERLARALRDLHDNPDLARAMGDKGRAEALARFSLPDQIDDYLNFYRTPTDKRAHADTLLQTA